jgi:WD40 repeat protein
MTETRGLRLLQTLASPFGETLVHAASASCARSIATSRRGRLAVFDVNHQRVSDIDSDELGDVWGAALAADGMTAVTVAAPSPDRTPDPDAWLLAAWDLRMGERLGTMPIGAGCYTFAASRDLALAMGAHRRRISWWHPLEWKDAGAAEDPHDGTVFRATLTNDGSLAATASPPEAYLWDVAARRPIAKVVLPRTRRFGRHPQVGSLRFASDRLYLGSSDGKVWMTDRNGAGPERVIVSGHEDWLEVLDVHEGCQLAAIAILGGHLEVWDLASGVLAGAVQTGHEGGITDVRITRDGGGVLTAGKDGTVRLWSLPS